MKFPNHIIIDVSKINLFNSNQYWILKYFISFIKTNKYILNLSFHKLFLIFNESILNIKFNENQKKFTIQYSNFNLIFGLSDFEKQKFLQFNTPILKVKNKIINENYLLLILKNKLYNIIKIKKIYKTLNNNLQNNLNLVAKSNNLWNLFNINFLKKEKIYTKLKYSRVPQYDIVSGGSAALLAGFLGFLISEKFGFELVDSGDFYFFFIYLVFIFFSIRLFFKIINAKIFSWNFISFKWLVNYIKTFIIIFIKCFKNIFNIL
jgi:hypothetical protein